LALTSLPLNHQLEDESTVFFFPLLPLFPLSHSERGLFLRIEAVS